MWHVIGVQVECGWSFHVLQAYKWNKPPATGQSDYSISFKYGIIITSLIKVIPLLLDNMPKLGFRSFSFLWQ